MRGIGIGIGLAPFAPMASDGRMFLLRSDFNTDIAAPIPSPYLAEPGPGTLTITDTGNKLTIASGALTFAAGSGFGNPGVWSGASFARAAGRAFITQVIYTAGNNGKFGWDSDNSGDADYISFAPLVSGQWRVNCNAVTTTLGSDETFVSGTSYQAFAILRAIGAFFIVKGGVYTNWTLIWVGEIGTTTPLYPSLSSFDRVGSHSYLRVLDLPAPFNTDYGLATQRLAGAQSAGVTFTHEANCVIEWTQTTLPTAADTSVQFRKQDDNNLWGVNISASGALQLYEVIAGVATSRANAAGVVLAGHRIVIVIDGLTIRGYSNNVLRWTYSSASFLATQTNGTLWEGGTGAVSDIISWPRTLTGAAAALLDASVA